MNCILKRCAHRDGPACRSLGECGAGFALRQAKRPCGYLVYPSDNPTIDALRRNGLIAESSFDGSTMTVKAIRA